MPKDKLLTPSSDPSHVSPLRSMMAEADGTTYRSYAGLAEARIDPNAVVILEGDDGGQIYVVVRASLVNCTEESLHQLLLDIDATEWNEPSMAHIYFESRPPPQGVPGGMGGGKVTNNVWIHERLQPFDEPIRAVLSATRARLGE